MSSGMGRLRKRDWMCVGAEIYAAAPASSLCPASANSLPITRIAWVSFQQLVPGADERTTRLLTSCWSCLCSGESCSSRTQTRLVFQVRVVLVCFILSLVQQESSMNPFYCLLITPRVSVVPGADPLLLSYSVTSWKE